MKQNNTPAGKIRHTGSQVVEPAFSAKPTTVNKVKKGDDLRTINTNIKQNKGGMAE